jgi:dTDP-4-dehydrorhamnose 3,5-epimerase
MYFQSFDLQGLLEVRPSKIEDERGYFSEIFRADKFGAQAGAVDFVQDNQSFNTAAGTIRGIHLQTHPFGQGKLVRCIAGSIFDVAVDLRPGSPTFGRWQAVTLTPELNNQFWLPEGFGHGFCTLEPGSIMAYRVTNYYSAEHDAGVAWDDKAIAIEWPDIADPATLSPKDRKLPELGEVAALLERTPR